MNQQRRQAGKAQLDAHDPMERWKTVSVWWVTDATGTFGPLRSCIKAQPGYERLLTLRDELVDPNDQNSDTVWNTGIAMAVAWKFVRQEKALRRS